MQSSASALSEPQLLAELRRWGITYLMTANGIHDLSAPLAPVDLITALAGSGEPRIRDALVTLFLLHPGLVDVIPMAIAQGDEWTSAQIQTLTLAALYEQRIWYPLLTMAFGRPPRLPEAPFAEYWKTWRLPPPWVDFGRSGEVTLVAHEQARTGLLLDYAGDWRNQIAHLVMQEWPEHEPPASCARPIAIEPAASEHVTSNVTEDVVMSFRRDVTQGDIEQFLRALGQVVRHASGRIYLVGDAELVHKNVRGQVRLL